jgi:hypothetical protein
LVRSLIRGAIHGEIRDTDSNEQPNEHAKIFLKLLQEVEKQLYPGCTDATDRHESTAVNEPPSGLSIFGEMDYKRRGQTIEIFGGDEIRKMRHYIISNCDEARPWVE